jgi:hypothetical protein
MKIEYATDWQEVHSELRIQIQKIGYNPDLLRLLNNITNMVTELSQLEVNARRTKKTTYTDEKVTKINEAIDRLEKILLIAKLSY